MTHSLYTSEASCVNTVSSKIHQARCSGGTLHIPLGTVGGWETRVARARGKQGRNRVLVCWLWRSLRAWERV